MTNERAIWEPQRRANDARMVKPCTTKWCQLLKIHNQGLVAELFSIYRKML